jgi:endonuclease YncB( thermonuclease family)
MDAQSTGGFRLLSQISADGCKDFISTNLIAGLVLSKQVSVKSYGKDRCGRICWEVFLGGTLIKLEMVRVELAEVYRGRPANGLDTRKYWKAEEAARAKRLNIWSLGYRYVSPKVCRKRKK